MFSCSRSCSRLVQVALLGFLFGGNSLFAQLDPRLTTGNTDFLNLFQQSSVAKVKPEILSIFDFSGSMSALMFHPKYVNTDTQDNDASSSLSFTLHSATTNTYTVTATSRYDSAVTASVDLTVGSSGAVTASNFQTPYLYTTNTSGHMNGSSVYTSTSPISVSGTSGSITLSLTIYNYNSSTSSKSVNAGVNGFAATGGTLNPTTTTYSNSSLARNTLYSRTNTTSWTVPAYKVRTDVYVSAAFSNYTAGSCTCDTLVRPDGSIVTKDNIDSNYQVSSPALNGESAKSADVRNWIRSASHARFKYTDGSVTRTVDIPIPWKIMDQNSTGYPLSSARADDPTVSVTNPDGSTSSYGSGLTGTSGIEMDSTYAINSGDDILTNNSTTASLKGATKTYHNNYLTFLFTGKAADGKYQVYDAANASLASGQNNVNWGQGFGQMASTETAAIANVVPAVTRVQACKLAVIKTWIRYQNDVFWAFRFLDGPNEAGKTTINNDSSTATPPSDPITTNQVGNDSGWLMLNNTAAQGSTSQTGNSITHMKHLAALFAGSSTPLTYAMARGLAQFSDPNSIFNTVETGINKPSQCMNHFLILFTDGLDNNNTVNPNNNTETPYIDVAGGTTGSALNGNKLILTGSNATNFRPTTSKWWDLFSFAGTAAHLADTSIKDAGGTYYYKSMPATAVSGDKNPDDYLPFAIKSRGTGSNLVNFDKDHRITTMTVGVSLGGTLQDTTGPKYRLLTAAATGDATDPKAVSWDLSKLGSFEAEPDPDNPPYGMRRKAGTTNFFDATDPQKLLDGLGLAIQNAIRPSNVNAASNPNLPYIGSAYGKQVYLGQFRPPKNGGVTWSGDLLMFSTMEQNNQIQIVDSHANPLTTLNASTAQWSAAAIYEAKTSNPGGLLWKDRKLFTRIPYGTTLKPFTDKGTDFSDSASGLKNYVSTSFTGSDADTRRQTVIQFAAGADTVTVPNAKDADGRPAENRLDIMGDIIDSSPAALEYAWNDVSGKLPPRLSGKGNRFRLILVGTNQGWLQAFGEVSQVTKLSAPEPNAGQEIVQGAVDELWSFMPTDFLKNLDYITNNGNQHRFMVDGTPSIYFLDLPPADGGTGNGVLDYNSDATKAERAIAIIGLRKGGRSYYALDIKDPFNPALRWSLVPDEATAANIKNRNKTTLSDGDLATLVNNMGFSSCTPGTGRVMFDSVLHDVVFLGGGFSVPEVDHNFPVYPNPPAAQSTPLGRSVLALDVYTGDILSASTLPDGAGPVGAGLVPFEYFLNSGMAQRAYFLDYSGGLWSWGKQSTYLSTGATDPLKAYDGYRVDSSDLKAWVGGPRKVFMDKGGTNARYTALPAPFRVGSFPGLGKTSSNPPPSAVGIAIESGDRNNPLDYSYSGTNPKPSQHQLFVVFDRQDHKLWDATDGPFDDSAAYILPAGEWQSNGGVTSGTYTSPGVPDNKNVPGDSSYFLAPFDTTGSKTPMLGYSVKFPAAGAGSDGKIYVSKGINTPMVVAGSLFYTYFTPTTADVCTGGSGFSYTNLICDVLSPVIKESRITGSNAVECQSGNKVIFTGVVPDAIAFGTRGVFQAGTGSTTDASGKVTTFLQVKTIPGQQKERYPKARVWRTVR